MVDIIINIACSGGLAYLGYRLRREQNRLSQAESAPTYSPSEALKTLNNPRFLTKTSNNPSEYKLRAFVEGVIDAKHPFKSKLEPNRNLVYCRRFKNRLYSNESVLDIKDSIQLVDERTFQSTKFNIKDVETGDVCAVNSCYNSQFEQVTHHSFNFHPKQLSTWENFLVGVARIYEFMGLQKIVRGVTIGWTEHEIGISVGSILTAYGELTYNAQEKTIKFDSPLYLIPDKATLVGIIRDEISRIKTKGYWLLIPFAITLLFIIRRIKRYYANVQKANLLPAIEEAKNPKFEEVDDEYRCVVCVDRPRDVILKPCLHFALCRECYKVIQSDKCLVCKEIVQEIVPVILS